MKTKRRLPPAAVLLCRYFVECPACALPIDPDGSTDENTPPVGWAPFQLDQQRRAGFLVCPDCRTTYRIPRAMPKDISR